MPGAFGEGVRRLELDRSLGRWAATAVAGVALAVLLGWLVRESFLKSAVPGLVSMNPLTAVCFLLAAASLTLLCDERPTTAGSSCPGLPGRGPVDRHHLSRPRLHLLGYGGGPSLLR